MVHVTKTNFLTQLSDFLHHLPNASFVAIDEEMTGINLPGGREQRPNKIELPGERYTRLLKGVPERYSILQVGVALFCENPRYRKRNAAEEGCAAGGNGSHDRGPADDAEENDENDEHAEREGNEANNDDENADDDDDTVDEEETDEEQPEYVSRIYNFYLFPDGRRSAPEREVTLNPSTVKFLLENHMDFDKVFREGIPYTTADRASYLKRRHFERYDGGEGTGRNGKGGGGNTPAKNRVKLTRVDDIAFVARTMAGLREWIDSDDSAAQNPLGAEFGRVAAADGGNGDGGENGANGGNPQNGQNGAEGTSLVLPPCNSFRRRCLYETIEDEYPGLVLERASTDPGAGEARNQIRVIRLSPAEKRRREDRLRRESWDRLLLQDLGFATVFQAISDACNGRSFSEEQTTKFLDGLSPDASFPTAQDARGGRKLPLVIHNGLMDLMFLLTHCHDTSLPESFEDTKRVIQGYFPNIYDTKVLGTEYSDAVIRSGNSALGDLFRTTCDADEPALSGKVPQIVNQDGRSRGQAHEAAWDAYMTGCVFNALCHRIMESKNALGLILPLDGLLHESSDALLREWIGLNRIYMHVSLYTIDLESSSGPAGGLHDPLSKGLSPDTTFHVSGITSAVSWRAIDQALNLGNESEEETIRELRYEIVWVDDASFFVGARMSDGVDAGDDADATGLVASHVRNRLRAGLGDVEIVPINEYMKNKYVNATKEAAAESGGIVGSLVSVATRPFAVLGSVLGFGKRPIEDGVVGGDRNKRRRSA